MKKALHSSDEVADLIQTGKPLLLAGDEEQLRKLPPGKWIGGSTAYFMGDDGGTMSTELIYVTELPDCAQRVTFKSYDIATIKNIYKDGYHSGFSVVIFPAASETLLSFAINAPDYREFATTPLIGWVSGVRLKDRGKKHPVTFQRSGQSASRRDAVAMHVGLPMDMYADIGIVNLFKRGGGPDIEFPESGFEATEAIIDGQRRSFVEYVNEAKLDVQLPLVADYSGTMINVSFQAVDHEKVRFYAPVFKGIAYKHAAPVEDYFKEFSELTAKAGDCQPVFSFNCVLNYLYSELEGKRAGNVTGPMTFGEIAYQLLNQTMVNLEIKNQ